MSQNMYIFKILVEAKTFKQFKNPLAIIIPVNFVFFKTDIALAISNLLIFIFYKQDTIITVGVLFHID